MICTVKKQKIKSGVIIRTNPHNIFCSEYQTVYNTMPNKPDVDDARNQNTALKALVDLNITGTPVFNKAEFLDIFSVHTNAGGEAQINWRLPGTYNPSLINAPYFLPYKGFYGEQAFNRVVDLIFNPFLNASLIARDNFCLIVGMGTTDENDRSFCGVWENGKYIYFKATGNNNQVGLNTTELNMWQAYNYVAHYGISRNNLTDVNYHRSGWYTNEANTAGISLPNAKIYACGQSATHSSSKEIRYVFLFSYLTPTEVEGIIRIMNEYLSNYSTHLYIPNNSQHTYLERVSKEDVIKGTLPRAWLGRPTMAVNSLGEWMVVYRHGTSHNDILGTSTHDIHFSDDEGLTWSNANQLVNGTPVVNAPFSLHVGNNNTQGGLIIECPNDDLLVHIYETGAGKGTYQWRSDDDGATWSDEGLIISAGYVAEEDYTTVGTDLYLIVRNGTGAGKTVYCYKSPDNGTTWSLQGTIDGPPTNMNTNETGIAWIGGNNLIAVMKEYDNSATFKYISTDLGVTWTQYDITSYVGIMHKPRLRTFGSYLFLIGRQYIGYENSTVVYFSSDNGLTWSEAFYPDEFPYNDCGYCDMLQKTNGDYYMLSYRGIQNHADIVEYIFKFK